jgi:preprotein translocase subunit SecF
MCLLVQKASGIGAYCSMYRGLFFISLTLVIAAIVVVAVFGFSFSVEFTGGSVLEVVFADARPAIRDITGVLEPLAGKVSATPTGEQGFIIRTRDLTEAEHQAVLGALEQFGAFEELRFESIGPVIGQELRRNAITAIIVALVLISLYITIVFRRMGRLLPAWAVSLGAIAALVHDLAIPAGVLAILGKVNGTEVDPSLIAAALTILGYSINDTVVVFDRLRENMVERGKDIHTKKQLVDVAHNSVMQVLPRSIFTTVSTLLAIGALFFFGGESLRTFSLALLIGIAAGAYSSIGVAVPIATFLYRGSK